MSDPAPASTGGGPFSFFGGGGATAASRPAAPKKVTPAPAPAPTRDNAVAQRAAQAEARKAAAEKAKQELEAKKAAQAAAAEEQKAAAEAQRIAAAEARERKAEEKRKAMEERKAAQAAAAEEKRKAMEERKAAQAAAAEERKAAAARAREEAEAKKAAAAAELKRKAEEQRMAMEAKKPVVAQKKPAPVRSSPVKPASQAPRGVPEIRSWTKRADGGVSGRIYGSTNFKDGDFVETSKISRGKIENGSTVSTASGSRYFLSAEPAVRQANILSAIKDMSSAKPGSTITLTKQRKEFEAQKAQEAVKQAKPRATFSLFGLGFGAADDDLPPAPTPAARKPVARTPVRKAPAVKTPPKKAPAVKTPPKKAPVVKKPATRAPPARKAPAGVPTLKRWKVNRSDGSVTGLIYGSPVFSDGDRVTTSAIAKGNIAANEVVTTGSGSRYFLS